MVFVGIAISVGSLSALFLKSLEWAAHTRNNNIWIISLLPLGGFVVAWMYKKWGQHVAAGNNLLIQEVQQPTKIINVLMAPLVLIGTIITHVFGGSAGREGTAVQMGGSIADQFNYWVKFNAEERRVLISSGVAAGFAGVFGTPFAGAVFAIEIIVIGQLRWKSFLPSLIAGYLSAYVCSLWPIQHTHYEVFQLPSFSVKTIALVALCAVLFGLAAKLFSLGIFGLGKLFNRYIKNKLLLPVVGGAIVATLGWFLGTKYLGLGIDVIVEAFTTQQTFEVFIIKLSLTVITLAAGFKGGEVTPLFFIGATLGSALSVIVPLPVSFIAAVGFVGVFAGATNAPLACVVMGVELFGFQMTPYLIVSCYVAYLCSGKTGIYTAQLVKGSKWFFTNSLHKNTLKDSMKLYFIKRK